MAHAFCWHCGLKLDGETNACPRCGTYFLQSTASGVNFDPIVGKPQQAGHPPALRCWHCGEPIAQQETTCSNCATNLVDRSSASIAYDVVPIGSGAGARPVVKASVPTQKRKAEPWASLPPVDLSLLDGDSPPSPPGNPAGPAAASPPPPRQARPYRDSGNYFTAHWRGEFPLGAAFWVNVVLVNWVLGLIVNYVLPFLFDGASSPITAIVAILAIWIFFLGLVTWQSVGVWRSAGNRIREKKRIHHTYAWAIIARIWMVLIVLGTLSVVVRSGIPQVTEAYEIAFLGDPDIPDYALEVTPAGDAIIVSGGVKHGLTDELARLLDENPGATTIYLDSPGGRLSEGVRLYDEIYARRLTTYVFAECSSACVMAFAGGRERRLGAIGYIGFHGPAVAGLDEPVGTEMDAVFRSAGFDRTFIRDAVAVPNDDIWYPTAEELLAAGVITRPRDTTLGPATLPEAVRDELLADFLTAMADGARSRVPTWLDAYTTLYGVDTAPAEILYLYRITGGPLDVAHFAEDVRNDLLAARKSRLLPELCASVSWVLALGITITHVYVDRADAPIGRIAYVDGDCA